MCVVLLKRSVAYVKRKQAEGGDAGHVYYVRVTQGCTTDKIFRRDSGRKIVKSWRSLYVSQSVPRKKSGEERSVCVCVYV